MPKWRHYVETRICDTSEETPNYCAIVYFLKFESKWKCRCINQIIFTTTLFCKFCFRRCRSNLVDILCSAALLKQFYYSPICCKLCACNELEKWPMSSSSNFEGLDRFVDFQNHCPQNFANRSALVPYHERLYDT